MHFRSIKRRKEEMTTQKVLVDKLNEVKQCQTYFHNFLIKNKVFFTVNKKVPRKAVDEFVKKYKLNLFKQDENIRLINDSFDMYVFPLTKSILATVRVKSSLSNVIEYFKYANKYYSELKKYNPKKFRVMPIDIIDVRQIAFDNYIIIEKVHPVVDVATAFDVLKGKIDNHRYSKSFNRFLKIKGLNLNEFNKKLILAVNEYKDFSFKKIPIVDSDNTGNILILDYDLKKDIFLFGPIDFIGADTRSI